ncbi:MAG TPA: DUF4350 domain-containing protein [Steroidobacteraceae bacterium]|nr:DUF4350 domain-containing protein [Steroidobacteraceae bacterium]
MKERLITLACALGALLLFITLFVHVGGAERPDVTLPTTVERGDNGLAAASTWLAGEHVPTRAVRARFDTALGAADLTLSGNLLVVSLPVATPFGAGELQSLDKWLQAGNTLLVLAALEDRPDWTTGRIGFDADLADLTGLGRETPRASARTAPPARRSARQATDLSAAVAYASRRLGQSQRSTLVPNRAHVFLDGVATAVALSDYPRRAPASQAGTLGLPQNGFMLCLARTRETGAGALWVRPHAGGTLIVSGFGSLFSNRALGLADNARLLANIVGASLGPGGTVLFDDEHQGLSDAYDPERFWRDPRLYATLGVLAALWLTWVLGGTRLRVPVSRSAAPREAQLVRTTGMFLARALSAPAAARCMYAHFFRRLRRHAPRALESAGPPWQLLERHPRIARSDLEQLREWYAAAHSAGRVPLTRLHNLMIRIERQLAA